MYALGACLYTLLFGRIPFSAPNLYKLFQVVQNDPVKYPPDVPISDALKDLLMRMLTKVSARVTRESVPQLKLSQRQRCAAETSARTEDTRMHAWEALGRLPDLYGVHTITRCVPLCLPCTEPPRAHHAV